MKKYIIVLVILFATFSHVNAATLKTSTLRMGSVGESVRIVQLRLSNLGYTVSVDGKFGKKTADAVAKFQAEHKFKADGLVGPKTLELINQKAPDLSHDLTMTSTNSICSSNLSSKLTLSDQEIFDLALKKQLGQCIIWDHRGLESACDYYVNTAIVGKLGATGYPKNPESGDSTGCVVAPTLPKGVGTCWGGYDKSTMCTNDYVKNAANQIRKAIIDNGCGCGVAIPSPVTPPVTVPPVTSTDPTGWEKVCSDGKPHIQVLSPNGGENYQTGNRVDVKWKSCNSSNPVKVELGYTHNDPTYAAGQYFEDWLIEQTSNNGLYSWTIPEYYAKGLSRSSFTVKVSIPGSVDYSDNKFTINPGVPVNSITVTNPIRGSFFKGDALPIKWITSGADQYSVSLFRTSDDSFVRLSLDTAVNGSGDLSWKIPNNLSDGNDYFIRVTEGLYRAHSGYSSPFAIMSGIIRQNPSTQYEKQ